MAQNNEQDNSLSIKDLVYACLRRWKTFRIFQHRGNDRLQHLPVKVQCL